MKLKRLFLFALLFAASGFARDYQIISTNEAGEVAELDSYYPSVSHDSRYIAFASESDNLVELTSEYADFANIFVKDLLSGEITAIEAPLANTHQIIVPSLSANGQLVVAKASTYEDDYIFAKDLLSGESMISRQLTDTVKVAGNGASWYYNVDDVGGFRGGLSEFPTLENAIRYSNEEFYFPQAFDISGSARVVQVNSQHLLSSMPIKIDSLTLNGKVIYQTQNNSFTDNFLVDSVSINAEGTHVLFAEKAVSKFGQLLNCELKLLEISSGSIEVIMLPSELSIDNTLCGKESNQDLFDISDDTRYLLINGVEVDSLGLESSHVIIERFSSKYEFVFVDENEVPLADLSIHSQPILTDDGKHVVFASNDRRLSSELNNTQILITENPLFNQ